MVLEGKTTAPGYVFNVEDVDATTGSDPQYDIIPLLTVGDEVPLIERSVGDFTTGEQTFAMAGIPDGLGYTEIDGLKYVWMNHELVGEVLTDDDDQPVFDENSNPEPVMTTEISSTVDGKINGSRVSLFVFDEDWNPIGGKNLIETVIADDSTYTLDLESGNYLDEDGNILNQVTHLNLSRFCSGFLAEEGFEGDPVWFAPEENGNPGRGWAVSPDGVAIALDGLGRYSKEHLLQEDETAFGGEIMSAEDRDARVLSYNIAQNEGVEGDDAVTALFELDESVEGEIFDGGVGSWESSGIIEVDPNALEGRSSYLFDVQAHGINPEDFEEGSPERELAQDILGGEYEEGGQLILAVPSEAAQPQPQLTGFAALPADTFAAGPPAGADDGEGNPISANDRTGPFNGQPIQGFSGVQFAPDGNGSFWFLSDNGFGAKANSADYLLRIYQVDPNFAGSEEGDRSVAVEDFIELADPNDLIPFEITNEESEDRLLTGADFDVESFVIDENGEIWVGDEFGPFLLHFDANGTLLEAPISTPNQFDGELLSEFNTLNGQEPIVIGHRGASGDRPEHTLAAYELAIEQGADFIEPDLVSTKDGVLIARHENVLAIVETDEDGNIVRDEAGNPVVSSETTNVAELDQFSDRLTTKAIDGEPITGWFSEDFTLAEIKELRARERIPEIRPDNTEFNDFEIPTLAEVIDLVKEVEAETGKKIGIYPETKHPTFFAKEGTFLDGTPIDISLGQQLIDTLVENDFTDPERIFIQSFEVENLLELQNDIMPEAGVDIPLVQLTGDFTQSFINETGGGFSLPYDVFYNFTDLAEAEPSVYDGFPIEINDETDYSDLAEADVLQYIGEAYAEGLGPWKDSFLLRESLEEPVDGDGDGEAEITTQLTGEVTSLIEDAHAAGLQVHPYTLRAEETFLTLNADGTPQTLETEIEQLIDLGVDGFFTDNPDIGDEVRDAVVAEYTAELVRSPDNPDVLAEEAVANLPRSGGFEGMAFSPDRTILYPLLEKSVTGDPDNALRIYEFDVASGEYEGLVGYYGTEDPGHAIGDFTPINDDEFLVIERDGEQADAASFKKIFKIDITDVDEEGFVAKEEVVDLLNIADPNDLNDDGSQAFEFPFVTIEDVVVVDENTILVANDNNYPFSVGRPPGIDNNEIILLELNESLDLDSASWRYGNYSHR